MVDERVGGEEGSGGVRACMRLCASTGVHEGACACTMRRFAASRGVAVSIHVASYNATRHHAVPIFAQPLLTVPTLPALAAARPAEAAPLPPPLCRLASASRARRYPR
eukprot:262543-Chlamydomonas_euryale.AAC.9